MINLIHGDCIEKMKDIPDGSVDLVLTDPPYNINKAQWDRWASVGEYITWYISWIIQIQRILKNSGCLYFFHNDMSQMSQIIEAIKHNTNFIFKSMLVLNKTDNSYVKDLYGSQKHFRNYVNMVEYCLFYTLQNDSDNSSKISNGYERYLDYMTEQKHKCNLSINEINKLVSNVSIASHWFWQPNRIQRQPRFINKNQYQKLQVTGCFKKEYAELEKEYKNSKYIFNAKEGVGNVFNISFKQEKRMHPTQKPINIIETFIINSSNENMTVLDPFMGSGTTGVACVNLNRNFIGIELDEKYFNIAKKRIEDTESSKLAMKKTDTSYSDGELF